MPHHVPEHGPVLELDPPVARLEVDEVRAGVARQAVAAAPNWFTMRIASRASLACSH